MTFNVWTFLFEAINFVVLAYVLHRLLYRPLHDAIDRRRELVNRAKTEADQRVRKQPRSPSNCKRSLPAWNSSGRSRFTRPSNKLRPSGNVLLADAEQTVQHRQEEVRQSLDRERVEALRVLRGEVVGQAIDLTRRLLQEASGRSLDQQLALRLAETLRELPADQLQKVRDHWQPSDGAFLESAQGLDDEVVAI